MKKFGLYEHVIWDWNGTLLDDVHLCASIMNKLLIQESLPQITVEHYRNIFTFPVIEYYKLAGHTFQRKSFEQLGEDFMINYEKQKKKCRLHPAAFDILSRLKSENKKQYLLSAYKQDLLDETINYFNLNGFFNRVIGLDNIYAGSKIHLGVQLISELRNNGGADNIVLIGDTIHDYQVAESIGADCILISAGHQSHLKLTSLNNVNVYRNLDELIKLINPDGNS